MFRRYPRVVMREKRVIYSTEGLKKAVKEGAKSNKVCVMSLYSFQQVKDKKVIWESAVIDCILWEGQLSFCEGIYSKFSNHKSIIIYDGAQYQVIIFKESTLEELKRLNANKQLNKMILIPGTFNLRTRQKCKIVKRNGI